MKIEKSLSIRIYPEVLKKLHYVADYEGRSANGHINYLIRKNIEEFERNIGEIDIKDK